MSFALGVIIGLLFAVLSVVTLAYLKASTGQPERFIKKVTDVAEGQHAIIIKPQTQTSKIQQAIIKEYEERGEEAPLIL